MKFSAHDTSGAFIDTLELKNDLMYCDDVHMDQFQIQKMELQFSVQKLEAPFFFLLAIDSSGQFDDDHKSGTMA